MADRRFQVKNDIRDEPFYASTKFMHTCHVCGKELYAPCTELWAYKRLKKHHGGDKGRPSYTWFCSWHCLSEYEKTARKKTSGQWATRRMYG